jgi:hypothetical protein
MLVTSTILGFGAGLVLDGVNVHYDASPPRKATARVLAIVPLERVSRDGAPELVLEEWRDASKVRVRTRYRSKAFHLDVDRRHATFYWREGFLGRPYAVEYPQGG